jgi:murein DD-endopeptidase MepM/ murein hydrolase activator NlpD
MLIPTPLRLAALLLATLSLLTLVTGDRAAPQHRPAAPVAAHAPADPPRTPRTGRAAGSPQPVPALRRPAPVIEAAAAAITFAKAHLGAPYRWGGTGPGGFDCSGLVIRAWQAAGVQLPRTAHAQAKAGPRITRDQLRPGDLVISNNYGHVQLYIGGSTVIEAPHTGAVVRVAALPAAGKVNAYVHIPETGPSQAEIVAQPVLNVRAAPTTSAALFGTITGGRRVTVECTRTGEPITGYQRVVSNAWLRVTFNGRPAWISAAWTRLPGEPKPCADTGLDLNRVPPPYPAGDTWTITQGFWGPFSHQTVYTRHGVDFGMPAGSRVVAVAPGTIRFAGWSTTGWGNTITIDHGGGHCSRYGHLDRVLVKAGDVVTTGTLIALSGSTGNSTGPHLHFQIEDCVTQHSVDWNLLGHSGSMKNANVIGTRPPHIPL